MPTARSQQRHLRTTVKQTRFRPTLLQQPRIPIWVAGYCAKSKAPFRRAARWDGVCPGQIKTPADVRAMVKYIGQYRTSAAPFDIVHFADIPQGTAAEVRARLEPWAEAGVTWWIIGFCSVFSRPCRRAKLSRGAVIRVIPRSNAHEQPSSCRS